MNAASYLCHGFICDTVRQELGDRATLVGIFPGAFDLPGPTLMPVGLFLRISPIPPEGAPVMVSIRLDDEAVIDFPPISSPQTDDGANSEDPALHVVIDRVILNIQRSGVLRMLVTVSDEPEIRVFGTRLRMPEEPAA